MGFFAPPPILLVSARREKPHGTIGARQGPSQHPRGYEKCGLDCRRVVVRLPQAERLRTDLGPGRPGWRISESSPGFRPALDMANHQAGCALDNGTVRMRLVC